MVVEHFWKSRGMGELPQHLPPPMKITKKAEERRAGLEVERMKFKIAAKWLPRPLG